jgi:uncharacterized membrane protein YphA (DoxX/SURF4 family)
LGLLLLRSAAGVTAFLQGTAYFKDAERLTFWSCVMGVLALLGGTSLLLGFLTPFGGSIVGAGASGIALSWFPSPPQNLLNDLFPTALLVVISTAIVLLGPGAMSLDARLFGRREIIIPHASRLAKP